MSEATELAGILTAQLERLFAERVDRATIRSAEDGQWPQALWQECEEMGLPLLLVPEESGGVGISWTGAHAIFKLLGQFVVPLPIGETVLAARLLADAGIEIPSGVLTLADGATLGGGASGLSGSLANVPWGRNAGHLVVTRPNGSGLDVHLVALTIDAITEGANIGREPRDSVRLDRLAIVASGTIASANPGLVEQLGAMLRSSQIAGALDTVRTLSIEYANIRVQFGKPIGKFQAVQQSLATLACEAAAADVAGAMAYHARDRGDDGRFETAVAKIRAGESASAGASLGHQAHGAIGFTDEYVLHDLTRRLWSWRTEFGSERLWADRLGRLAIDAGPDLWNLITNPAEAAHG